MVSQLAKCATLRQILEFETQVSVSLVFCHKTFASPDDPFEKVNFACHKRIQYRSVPLHIYTSEGLFFWQFAHEIAPLGFCWSIYLCNAIYHTVFFPRYMGY